MTPEAYLRDEIGRYFPGAHIAVTFHDDGAAALDLPDCGEAIEITVSADADSDPDYTFVMAIGSDDDCFRFDNGDGYILTVPFCDESKLDSQLS